MAVRLMAVRLKLGDRAIDCMALQAATPEEVFNIASTGFVPPSPTSIPY